MYFVSLLNTLLIIIVWLSVTGSKIGITMKSLKVTGFKYSLAL